MKSFGDIIPLQSAIDTATRELGIDRRIREQRIIDEWSAIVGDGVAKEVTIRRLEQGTLILRVPNSVWRQELLFSREKMIAAINAYVGEETVTKIVLR